jgi:hypothetical protein
VVLITDGEPVCSDRSQRTRPTTTDSTRSSPTSRRGASRPSWWASETWVDVRSRGARPLRTRSGGTTPSADKPYYDAADGAQLLAALQDITGAIVDCDFVLGETPPADDLYVFFDDITQVAHDPTHVEGWDYDPVSNTLAFYGQACQMLQEDQVADIDVVYGCPAPKLE